MKDVISEKNRTHSIFALFLRGTLKLLLNLTLRSISMESHFEICLKTHDLIKSTSSEIFTENLSLL